MSNDAARLWVISAPSGAGKTLTVQALAGLMRPACGSIRVSGRTYFDAVSSTSRRSASSPSAASAATSSSRRALANTR